MTEIRTWRRRARWIAAAVALVLISAACGAKNDVLPVDPAEADRFLFERGMATLKERKWMEAREYFRQVIDNYPGSLHRAEAKLGIADAYLGENSSESRVLAAAEYREFLTFYPTHPRADYAQYSLAMTFFRQMRAPDRDFTPTKEALAEFDTFFQRYPQSPLTAEVKQNWRIARDRLSESSYNVGLGYFRRNLMFAAIPRFREILDLDPGFSRIDGVYYHLAEALARSDRKAEAVPLFDRLIKEHPASEFVERAQTRLKELQAQ
jgi:outer membrane protein assembly factor BamD